VCCYCCLPREVPFSLTLPLLLCAGPQHNLRTEYYTDSPGFNINFESAPFKLTREYLDLLGGPDSEDFKLFQDLFLRGFLALQKHIDGITAIIQVC
jgi:hypothetical protein